MDHPCPQPPCHPTDRLVGTCPAIAALRAQIRHLAAFDTLGNPAVPTVLLQGETGTGKGLVARVLHDSGPRAQGPFLDVNCAAIPEALLEAELFGVTAGAFTDAKRAKPGLFEAATGGTLFLDEIDALPLALQGKLLTAIEAKRVRRVGAVREQAVDVKVVAATQAELSTRLAVGQFCADLYYRLAVLVLALPPLREREEDIVCLAQGFLQQYAAAHRLPPKRLSRAAVAWLLRYDWPGNVRELSHLMERVTLLSPEALIDPQTLERLCLPRAPSATHGAVAPAEAMDQPLDEATRITQALRQTQGNVVQAARVLGLGRKALRYRMQRYGLAPLKQRLTRRTEGNPFFLEESVQTLVETQGLVGAPGAYRPAQPLATMQVPATVQAMLAARLDRLSLEAKHLLQERRRGLHARIVEALEALYPERLAEQVERLADHALRGEVWEKAVAYCWQAGVKAHTHSAYREAIAFLERALEALQHLQPVHKTREEAIDIRIALRNPLHALGERERILAYLREAETLAVALDDCHRLGRVSAFMGHCFVMMGDYARALEPLQRALAIAEDGVDLPQQVIPRFARGGGAYYHLGDYRRAIDCLRWGVESIAGKQIYERFGQNSLPSVNFRSWLSRCLAELGAFAEGIVYGEEGIRIAEAADHPYTCLGAYWGVGFLYLRKGELHTAISILERGLRFFQGETSPVWFNEFISHLGYAYALFGRATEAVPLLTQAVERFTAMGQMPFQAMRVAWLSEAHLLAGHIDKAVLLARRALELSHKHKERGHQAWILRLLGEIAAQCNPPQVKQAEAYYQQAIALAEALGMRPLQAHCHRGLGMLYARRGQREQTRTALATAIELYRTRHMAFWLPQAEAALAQSV